MGVPGASHALADVYKYFDSAEAAMAYIKSLNPTPNIRIAIASDMGHPFYCATSIGNPLAAARHSLKNTLVLVDAAGDSLCAGVPICMDNGHEAAKNEFLTSQGKERNPDKLKYEGLNDDVQALCRRSVRLIDRLRGEADEYVQLVPISCGSWSAESQAQACLQDLEATFGGSDNFVAIMNSPDSDSIKSDLRPSTWLWSFVNGGGGAVKVASLAAIRKRLGLPVDNYIPTAVASKLAGSDLVNVTRNCNLSTTAKVVARVLKELTPEQQRDPVAIFDKALPLLEAGGYLKYPLKECKEQLEQAYVREVHVWVPAAGGGLRCLSEVPASLQKIADEFAPRPDITDEQLRLLLRGRFDPIRLTPRVPRPHPSIFDAMVSWKGSPMGFLSMGACSTSDRQEVEKYEKLARMVEEELMQFTTKHPGARFVLLGNDQCAYSEPVWLTTAPPLLREFLAGKRGSRMNGAVRFLLSKLFAFIHPDTLRFLAAKLRMHRKGGVEDRRLKLATATDKFLDLRGSERGMLFLGFRTQKLKGLFWDGLEEFLAQIPPDSELAEISGIKKNTIGSMWRTWRAGPDAEAAEEFIADLVDKSRALQGLQPGETPLEFGLREYADIMQQICKARDLLIMPCVTHDSPANFPAWDEFIAALPDTRFLQDQLLATPYRLTCYYYTHRAAIECHLYPWRKAQAVALAARGQALVGQYVRRRRLADRAAGTTFDTCKCLVTAYCTQSGKHQLLFKRDSRRKLPEAREWHDLSEV